jgi:nuclear GTP-binding protein
MLIIERISKRVNSRQRNRIQKKVAEHHRKVRKLAKQNPQWKSKKPKDLGVPNSFPFKERVLAEREELRRRREEERRKKKEGNNKGEEQGQEGEETGQKAGVDGTGVNGNGLKMGVQIDSDDEMMEEDEEEEDDEGDEAEEEDAESSEGWEGIPGLDSEEEPLDVSDVELLTEINTERNSSRSPHMEAIDRSDLLVFVLDARAPEATRIPHLETWAKLEDIDAIFVLNRAGIPLSPNIDVENLPPEVLLSWVLYLTPVFPAFPLITKKSTFNHSLTPSVSLNNLREFLQVAAGTACLLGVPSVGKTNLLKTLLGHKKETTLYKPYDLKKYKIIDTQGIVVPEISPELPSLISGETDLASITALLNVLDAMGGNNYEQVEKLYGMPALVRPMKGNRFIDPTRDLLIHVARSFGRLGKNGPNLNAAAGIVGRDCREGKIQWWTLPPTK